MRWGIIALALLLGSCDPPITSTRELADMARTDAGNALAQIQQDREQIADLKSRLDADEAEIAARKRVDDALAKVIDGNAKAYNRHLEIEDGRD